MFYGEVVYSDAMFTATEAVGYGMFMYFTKTLNGKGGGERCGTILNGRAGFEKQYGGDFQKWIKAIQKRELKTMQSYRRQAEDMMSSARHMQRMNEFTEEQFNG